MNALAGLKQFDIAGNAQNALLQGIKVGDTMRKERERRDALTNLAANPNDPTTANALLAVDPELALRVRDNQRQETTFQNGQRFNTAAGKYMNALTPAMPIARPSQPLASVIPPEQPQISERDQAFYDMAAIDPVKAMKIDSDARNQALERLKALDDVYDLAIERLGGAVDEDSYQALLADVGPRFQQFGQDVLKAVPANYPGPEGIRALLQSSMAAKDQLAALDRSERITADTQDDEIDNARADREASSRIDARRRGAANAERRTQISASRPAGRAGKAPKLTATNPATGETITLNSRGQWVDKNGKPVQ
jgi:hypothetical protein